MAKFKVGDRVRCIGIVFGYTIINNRCGKIINSKNSNTRFLVEFDENIGGHDGANSWIKGKDGHCWWVDDKYLELAETPKFKVGDRVRVCRTRHLFKKSEIGNVYTINKINPNAPLLSATHYDVKERCRFVFEEFELESYVEQPNKIVITTDGTTTTAKRYRDKSVVKVKTAKCHSDDKFDFMVGAKVAFDRLVGEEKEAPKGTLNIEVDKKYKFAYDIFHTLDNSHKFKVYAIHNHGNMLWSDVTLAYIEDLVTERCYLIDIKGLERIH
jgi:hypothetical protein